MSAGNIPFRKDMAFEYGQAREVAPGVRRIVAENPSAFTYKGTNTYIVGSGEVAVIDPGPLIERHLDNIEAALDGETVTHIVVTHTHMDHSPASTWLRQRTGAPIVGAAPGLQAGGVPVEAAQTDFKADITVSDGTVVQGPGWTLEAVPTPGHMSNHHCFALRGASILFSGDHVMGWNTTIVSPPDGNMRAYLDSLRLCLTRRDSIYLPGHGPEITNPRPFVRHYLAHRLMREREIARCVENGIVTVSAMVKSMYRHLPQQMHGAASRSVLAHLEHMVETGRLTCGGPVEPGAVFGLPDSPITRQSRPVAR